MLRLCITGVDGLDLVGVKYGCNAQIACLVRGGGGRIRCGSVPFSSLYVYDGTVQTAQPFGLDSNPRDRGTEVPTLQRAAPTTRGSCNVLYTTSDTRAPGAQAKHWSQRALVTSYPLARARTAYHNPSAWSEHRPPWEGLTSSTIHANMQVLGHMHMRGRALGPDWPARKAPRRSPPQAAHASKPTP